MSKQNNEPSTNQTQEPNSVSQALQPHSVGVPTTNQPELPIRTNNIVNLTATLTEQPND